MGLEYHLAVSLCDGLPTADVFHPEGNQRPLQQAEVWGVLCQKREELSGQQDNQEGFYDCVINNVFSFMSDLLQSQNSFIFTSK